VDQIFLWIFGRGGIIIDHRRSCSLDIMPLGSSLNLVLNEFGWTKAMTSGAFSLSSMMMGLLAVAAGRLTDKYASSDGYDSLRLILRFGFYPDVTDQ